MSTQNTKILGENEQDYTAQSQGQSYTIVGNDLDNSLTGGNKDDIIIGGGGDDILTGGKGDDTFVFNFTLSEDVVPGDTVPMGPDPFAAWLASEDLIDNASQLDGALSQNEFVQYYKAWVEYVVEGWLIPALLGEDFDTSGDYSFDVSFKQNAEGSYPAVTLGEGLESYQDAMDALIESVFLASTGIDVSTGKKTQERYYSDLNTEHFEQEGSAETVISLSSNDGHDTIMDFTYDEKSTGSPSSPSITLDEGDKLKFVITYQNEMEELSENHLKEFFVFEFIDVNDDGKDDLVIRLKDDSWSATLLGGKYEDMKLASASDIFAYANETLGYTAIEIHHVPFTSDDTQVTDHLDIA
ncbi:hypothetical protein LY622_20845 [Halomonas sp. M5N1S17]|uniref:hypothetical protein n=1 Tax=Halomonas alkalisoli TaxID=2907158 RepID=UPI001F48E1F0|nr:hypothetical protein [Halomonas alkalisoli]MCE9665880.1 hypothetical protein [Halomonas alkalisoli]